MSNILRQQMLETWSYPALKENLRGVNEYSGDGRYAGRIKSLEPFILEWGGENRDFSVSELRSEYLPLAVVGDLVAVTVSDRQIQLLSLLAPARVAASSTNFQWPKFVGLVREFFNSRQFTEILTPVLVDCPGTEPYLKPFTVEVKINGRTERKYLPTSPEINLKKALARGHSRIFELKECFRNDEHTPHHRPEFLMLEWYRAFSNLDTIVDDLKLLVKFLSERMSLPLEEFHTRTVAQMFEKHVGFQLKPDTSSEELAGLCKKLDLSYNDNDSWDELFFRVFVEKIEPQFSAEPLILRDYPPKLAAYSRIQENGWADRFEFYWKGLEIANAFHELNDPRVQRARMEEDNRRKAQVGLEPVALDEQFLKALESGFPPSGGIALGVERLFMAFHDLNDIGSIFDVSK